MADGGSPYPSVPLPARATAGAARDWWSVPPRGQVSHLSGVDPELLAVAVDPLPETAPVVVRYRPLLGISLAAQVTAILDELESAAVALYPRWLPGAERLDEPGMLGVAAVRALARQAAARSGHFGPFLAELAGRCLDPPGRRPPRRPGGRSGFPAEVRAAGLTRVVAEAYGRDFCVLLIELPAELTASDERVLAAAAEWLAEHGRLTVWLAGPPLRRVDRIRPVAVSLPAYLTRLADDVGVTSDRVPESAPPGLTYPPLSGLPRADSAAELALERALAPHEWARGRRWNHTYDWHLLGRPYRLDLYWSSAGLAVEVDGPEHRGRMMFADDRRRDVQLQILGLDVLRFTNEQVFSDVDAVVEKIRQLLVRRVTNGTYRPR
ncbi:endonuclease domain-containing protein [Micromonospora sp. RTP1Z1]|uniref:endonuclease domain-containing protein n=1 Tax=Micromonospora sp. RTP1Z1 TaxID=2994043 RepID=UPI0029C791B0|nr:DUF559 domain-containing protein [Micromonospora sp. RTP1Z1]